MGMFEKRRFKKFLVWCQNFEPSLESTWNDLNPEITTMQQVYLVNSLISLFYCRNSNPRHLF